MTWLVIERPGVKLYKPFYSTLKRLFDVTLSLLALIFLSPLIVMIILLIRFTSPGPVLFEQDRLGKGGKLFRMYKFRTMYHQINRETHRAFMKAFINGQVAADGEHEVFKPFDSSQVTSVGRILRKTSLDELPQLINILNGEMSLVGPRPNVPWEAEEYCPWHQERFEVLPGITGLAQVRGRSAILFDEIVRCDVEYIERQSLRLDIQILWRTVVSVLIGKGAH